jgi:hypothetical protein
MEVEIEKSNGIDRYIPAVRRLESIIVRDEVYGGCHSSLLGSGECSGAFDMLITTRLKTAQVYPIDLIA